MKLAAIAGCLMLLVAGCATTGGEDAPSVLSGEATVERVVSAADRAAKAGDYRAATLLYRQALRQQPSAEIWYRLGMAFREINESQAAVWSFGHALELDPEHLGALERVALHLASKGDPAAVPRLEFLLERAPDNWRAHNALGVLADMDYRFDEAARRYAAALEIHPRSTMLWNNLGMSQHLAGRTNEAVLSLERARALDRSYSLAVHNLALVYAHQDRFAEALEVMLTVADPVQAYSDIGYLAFRLGHPERAEGLLYEALQRSGHYHDHTQRIRAQLVEVRRTDSVEALQRRFSSSLDRFLEGR